MSTEQAKHAGRPCKFTAEWVRVTDAEMQHTKLMNFRRSEVYICRTSEGLGVLAKRGEDDWTGTLLTHEDEFRCYWSTSYRHPHRELDRATAQDLTEAALVGASLVGIERVGSPAFCP